MFEKLIGLSFASAAADMLLSGSSFKKYIKALIGAMFVLTVITQFSSAGEINIEIPEVEEAKYESTYETELRKQVVLNTEAAIKEKLSEEGISVSKMTIDFEDDYYIKKLTLSLKNYSKDKKKAIELLVNYFKIDKEVINICQG